MISVNSKVSPSVIVGFALIFFGLTVFGCEKWQSETSVLVDEQAQVQESVKTANAQLPIAPLPIIPPEYESKVSTQVDDLLKTGQNFRSNYKFQDAETAYLNALKLAEKKLGENHQKAVLAHNELAKLYRELGKNHSAEPHLLRMVEATQHILGNENPRTADMYDILGSYYFDNGSYALAEPYFKKALGIRLAVLGENHIETGTSFQNLGMLYAETGRPRKAEYYYKRVLEIDEENSGTTHLNTASALNNLATLYSDLNRLDEAELLFTRALSITVKILGENHPISATAYDNLALLYSSLGRFSKSILYHNKALEILLKSYGARHPETGTVYNNLGLAHSRMGNLSPAEENYRHALLININTLGKYHPHTMSTLSNLLFLYWRQKRWADADIIFHAVYAALTNALNENLNIGLSGEGMQMLERLSNYHNLLISYGVKRSLGLNTYDIVTTWKGLGYESSIFASNAATMNPEAQKVRDELAETLSELSALVTMRQTIRDPVKKQNLETVIAGKQGLATEMERHLNSLSYSYRINRELLHINSRIIRRALKTDQVLVDIIRYRQLAENKKAGDIEWDKDKRYAAFIITKDDIVIFDLGSASVIDNKIEQFRNMIDPQSSYATDSFIHKASIHEVANDLYQLVFARYQPLLKEYDLVLISPDGLLATIPFGVFVDDKGKYLIESYNFSYISSARDLLRTRQQNIAEKKALVVGDPDFSYGTTSISANAQDSVFTTKGGFFADIDPGINKPIRFGRLEETAEEARAVAEAFQNRTDGEVELLTQLDATEDNVKAMSSGKRLLYFSTHGFFFGLPEHQSQNESPRGSSVAATKPVGVRVNPLTQCGIVLTGANKDSMATDSGDDGLLTGAEIVTLDLTNTDLVVLAACVTGLGQIQESQGLMGLRYAFTVAGAKTVVASSWHVPSKETKELMEQWIPQMLSSGHCAHELRRSKVRMIQELRKAGIRESPFYWGAFTCSGGIHK